MAPGHRHMHSPEFQVLSTSIKQQNLTFQPPIPSTDSGFAFPILVVSVASIIGTVLLLLGYYVFVSKCCNWHQLNLLRRFSALRHRQYEESFIAFSPSMWNQGLDDSIIRDIPAFQFRREEEIRSVFGCVVCLNEFQEQDMLRVLPKCSHAFHLDCIDIWLQGNANCPLCRTSISGTTRYPIDQIIAPRSSPQSSQPYTDSLIGGDEDFVVIELGGEVGEGSVSVTQHESDTSSEVLLTQSPNALEQKQGRFSKCKKRHHVSIMGDECIDTREKDNQFCIQPIRRSFSLDSAADHQLYLTVQEIINQKGHYRKISTNEESSTSTSTRVRRSFFPFGHGKGSRNAVLPIECEV